MEAEKTVTATIEEIRDKLSWAVKTRDNAMRRMDKETFNRQSFMVEQYRKQLAVAKGG